MRTRFTGASLAIVAATLWLSTAPTAGQAPSSQLFPTGYKAVNWDILDLVAAVDATIELWEGTLKCRGQ